MNFFEYIENDIKEKNVLLTYLPKNTEKRKQKYLDTIKEIYTKYEMTNETVKHFIMYKYNKFLPKESEQNLKLIKQEEELNEIKKMLILFNDETTYLEQLGIDILLYELMYYYKKSISQINVIISQLIVLLKKANIKVDKELFSNNIYVYFYMTAFLENYANSDSDNRLFQKIFLKCPKIFEYLIIDFRIILQKNKFLLNHYIKSLRSEMLEKYKIKNVNQLEELKKQHIDYISENSKPSEYDIVHACMNDELDVNTLSDNSETLGDDLNIIAIKNVNLKDKSVVDEFISHSIDLKHNLLEYQEYLNIIPIIDDVKKKYKDFEEKQKNIKNSDKELLAKINKKYKEVKKHRISPKNYTIDNIDSIISIKDKNKIFLQHQALDQLYKLYIELNDYEFDKLFINMLRINTSVNDVLSFIINHHAHGIRYVKKIFNFETEDDLLVMMEKIDKLVFNPYKRVINMINIFVDENVCQQIANGYRFLNLDVNEDSFELDNINKLVPLCDKIEYRVIVKDFKLSVDKIQFLVNVDKLIKENKI